MRWLWLAKTEPEHLWASLTIKVPSKVKEFFSMAMQIVVGDEASTLFWTDQWLFGHRTEDLAPQLFAIIPKRRADKQSVLEGTTNQT
jgi:hypothetical protein